MREIIQLQLGQCGNQVGLPFWELLCKEHGVDQEGISRGASIQQTKRVNVFFDELQCQRYIPRCLLLDLEPGVLDSVRSSEYGRLFKPDNFLFSHSGAGNNWAKGHYTEGPQMIDQILGTCRKEAENCDCLQGFYFVHSVGGGTGSGLGTLLLSKLREEYPDRMLVTFSIFPALNVSESVVEPYNAMLALNQLIEFSNYTITLDNTALNRIAQKQLKIQIPSYTDLNGLIALGMSNMTASLRFPGQLNSDLRKLAVNLCVFPRLHFLVMSHAPLYASSSLPYRMDSVQGLLKQQFDPLHMMCDCDIRQGRFLTTALLARGIWGQQAREVEETVTVMAQKQSKWFIDWIPNHVMVSACDVPPPYHSTSSSLLGNTSAITQVFSPLSNQFSTMLQRKAFLHWYLGEGMDENEFHEAKTNVNDLISEYQQCETEPAGIKEDLSPYFEDDVMMSPIVFPSSTTSKAQDLQYQQYHRKRDYDKAYWDQKEEYDDNNNIYTSVSSESTRLQEYP
jgi:tubulin beta